MVQQPLQKLTSCFLPPFIVQTFIALLWIQPATPLLCILIHTLPLLPWIIHTIILKACLIGLVFFFELKGCVCSIHSFGLCCTVSELPLESLLSHCLSTSTPSSCHQTITLVLHPFSSLPPPPSQTLVLPHMKPKVSSRGGLEL